MTLETNVRALLDLVEADRARRCEAIERDARALAGETRAAARSEALERLRAAFADERERRDARIAVALAKLETHRRLHQQRRAAALLAAGWQRLPDVLCDRWAEPGPRQAWVSRVVAEARTILHRGAWHIVHALPWPESERNELRAALAHALDASPEFLADPMVRAGLRISAGGNTVDGTLSGLLADRADIGARLLRHVEDA
jgi:hypothetical protein